MPKPKESKPKNVESMISNLKNLSIDELYSIREQIDYLIEKSG